MQPSHFKRRQLLSVTASLLASLSSLAHAQDQRAIRRVFVGFPPGGTADNLGRALANQAPDAKSVYVIENKSGAAGQLAALATLQAPADGNHLLLTPSSVLTLAPQLYKTPLFNPQRDLQPLACLGDHSFALAVSGRSAIHSLAEYIAWVKNHPTLATFASPGLGSAPHFLGVQMGRDIGTALTHVPYRGVAPGLQDLMAGQVMSSFSPLPTLLDLHQSGRIRILAVTSASRLSSLPEVPTFAQAGLPNLQLVEWYGLFASAKTPATAVASLSADIQKSLKTPGMIEAAKRLEVNLRYEDAATLGKLVAQDQERWKGLVAQSGVQLD